jgi:Rab9 effector protein with kelch motifs
MPLDRIGFKTFTEMMKTNTSWINQVPQLSSHRETETEVFSYTKEFPTYLQNRLKFNKTQTHYFQKAMDQKWDALMTEQGPV